MTLLDRIIRSFEQLRYLRQDLTAQVNRKWWRWLSMWLWYGSAPAIVAYRINRCLYLLLGEPYRFVRVLLWPLFLPLRLLGPTVEITYRTDIGPGFKLLHPGLGVLISRRAVCGRNLVLTGGNCIVLKERTEPGDIKIGDNVVLGANSIVLGAVKVGDRCVVGAGAVVLADCEPGSVMVGVPARPTRRREGTTRNDLPVDSRREESLSVCEMSEETPCRGPAGCAPAARRRSGEAGHRRRHSPIHEEPWDS